MTSAPPQDVAEFMRSTIEREHHLHQARAVELIRSEFGGEFIYRNENGNPAIDKRVLRAFRKLTGESVVWDRTEKYWVRRQPGHRPGRMQT